MYERERPFDYPGSLQGDVPASPIYGIRSTLIDGDALNPSSVDLISQVATLDVGQPVPEGWRVLTGNARTSQIGRVAYRYEIEDKPDPREALEGIVREMIFGDGTDACLQRTIDLCVEAQKRFGIEREG